MSFFLGKSLPDYKVTADGWVDLTSTSPGVLKRRFVLLQRKGSATLTVAPTDSAEPPTEDIGVVLSTREKLTIAASHIWVRGKGALIGITLCERA